jgi:hypothetical protein
MMVSFKAPIEVWCEEYWGQTPEEISEWVADEEISQVFIKLARGVLIVDFAIGEEGELTCQEHLHIPLDRWNPGSIQVHRTHEGLVRFRHRQSEILLSARLRAPEWGKALLEEWLMSQRGDSLRPKEKSARIAAIKRSKLSIERNLKSASLDSSITDLELAKIRITSAERQMEGRNKA